MGKKDEACEGWKPGNYKTEPWKQTKAINKYLEAKRYLTCESYRSKMMINVWNAMSATLAKATKQSSKRVPIILGVSVPMPTNNGVGIALSTELPSLIDSEREEWVAIHVYGAEECNGQKNKPDFDPSECKKLQCRTQLEAWKKYWLTTQKQPWKVTTFWGKDSFKKMTVWNAQKVRTTIVCFDWKYPAEERFLTRWPYGFTVEKKDVLEASAFPRDYLQDVKSKFFHAQF